jgi:hypothetical protein
MTDRTKASATRRSEAEAASVLDMLEAQMQAQQAFLNGMTRCAREVGDFMQTRMNENVATVQGLGRCKSVGEMIELETEYMQKAAAQYFQEASRLMDLATDTTLSGLNCLDRAANSATARTTAPRESS